MAKVQYVRILVLNNVCDVFVLCCRDIYRSKHANQLALASSFGSSAKKKKQRSSGAAKLQSGLLVAQLTKLTSCYSWQQSAIAQVICCPLLVLTSS